MYTPSHFEETRAEPLAQLLRDHPLGLLVTHGAQGLEANPLPFLYDEQPGGPGVLTAHVARANPVWKDAAGSEVLVMFQGPQAYISPNWYPSKLENGKAVPTWNYIVVQARGKLVVRDDVEWLRGLVTRLTLRHESMQAVPWQVSDAPSDYLNAMLRAIVGIEIPLSSLRGKWKMSQNQSATNREGVVRGLRSKGNEMGGEEKGGEKMCGEEKAATAAWIESCADSSAPQR